MFPLFSEESQVVVSKYFDQEKKKGTERDFRGLGGICEFHLIIFSNLPNGSWFPERSANSQCDVTESQLSIPTSRCVMASVE